MLVKECEYIWKVYQEHSFSRAAEKLYITQPALSIAVKKFEEKLGVTLFDRRKTPLQLTPEGECFIDTLRKMNTLESEMLEYFAERNANRTGSISIISTGYYFSYTLPQIIDSFCEKYPGYQINSYSVDTQNLEARLRSNLIDMCFTVKDFSLDGFDCQQLYMENLILAVPSSFAVNAALAPQRLSFSQVRDRAYLDKGCPSVPIRCFADVPFLMLQKYNDLSLRAAAMFKEASIEPHILWHLDQMLTTYYVAAAGVGAAFIRTGLIDNVEPTDKLCFYRVDDPRMERSVKLYYRRDRAHSGPYADFIRFMRDWSHE